MSEMNCQCGLRLLRLGCPACTAGLSAGLGLVREREMLELAGHAGKRPGRALARRAPVRQAGVSLLAEVGGPCRRDG